MVFCLSITTKIKKNILREDFNKISVDNVHIRTKQRLRCARRKFSKAFDYFNKLVMNISLNEY